LTQTHAPLHTRLLDGTTLRVAELSENLVIDVNCERNHKEVLIFLKMRNERNTEPDIFSHAGIGVSIGANLDSVAFARELALEN
jgi:hypothetical protein